MKKWALALLFVSCFPMVGVAGTGDEPVPVDPVSFEEPLFSSALLGPVLAPGTAYFDPDTNLCSWRCGNGSLGGQYVTSESACRIACRGVCKSTCLLV